jgi:hypothetical protein
VPDQTVHVAGGLEDRLGRRIHNKQNAMWLDGAWDVDRLAVTGGKVNWLHTSSPEKGSLPL